MQHSPSISVVIPTLNAAAQLAATLKSIGGGTGDVIISDGGSTDDTCAIASAAGARMVSSEKGRGQQLGTGAAAATGDWLLFLITGFMICVAQLLLIVAYRYSQASTLAPFRYFSIIWGTAIGYLVWHDIPDAWTLAGSTLIIASGLYILHRQRV